MPAGSWLPIISEERMSANLRCNTCSSTFSRPSNLVRHVRSQQHRLRTANLILLHDNQVENYFSFKEYMKQPSNNEETHPAVCSNTYTVENEIDELSDMEIGRCA